MGFLEKGVLLYLCLAIAISFFNPSIVLSNQEGNSTSVLGLFDIGYNVTTNEPFLRNAGWNDETMAKQLNYTTDATTSNNIFKKAVNTISDAFQWVVDGLANVMNVVKLFFKFIFSPFIFIGHLVGLGAPTALVFAIAIPLTMLFVMGVIRFIRGGSD